jgi:predicted RNA-binding Zn-ribbon protein involved in translation (DUF1610 family)
VWLLALTALVAFSRFNLRLAERRSAVVIAACHRFASEQGRLPASLDDLVPAYLPSVPRADWTIRGFLRYQGGPSPELSYFAPWPREVVYSFATGERHIRSESLETAPGGAPGDRRVLEGGRSAVELARAAQAPVTPAGSCPDLECQGLTLTIVSNTRRWRLANQVTHAHECPECGQAGTCFSPECRALTHRVCDRCMERAWQHSRRSARSRRPAVPERRAA